MTPDEVRALADNLSIYRPGYHLEAAAALRAYADLLDAQEARCPSVEDEWQFTKGKPARWPLEMARAAVEARCAPLVEYAELAAEGRFVSSGEMEAAAREALAAYHAGGGGS